MTQSYTLRSGLHPEASAYTALLAEAGIADPESNAPLSEAMVLGIAGGLGIGYILWELRSHSLRVLVMGMRNRWQYPASFYQKLEERLNVRFAVAESAGDKGARAALDATLALQRPAMLWVDGEHLPHMGLPEELDGCIGHTLVVYGIEDGKYLVDDRAASPFRLKPDVLAAARGRIPSYKNRLLMVESASPFDLRTAVRAGIADCAEHLAGSSDSFSLPVLRKWARLMTDTHNAKGWPRVFADRRALFSMLLSVFQNVSDYGMQGGSLRGLYAEFLREAATLLENPSLLDVAERYRWLGLRWGTLGEVVLPTAVPPLARAKELVAQRHALLAGMGGDGLDAIAPIDGELRELRRRCDADFPMDGAAVAQLFEAMQAEIQMLHAEEVRANHELRAAIGQTGMSGPPGSFAAAPE